MSVIRRSALMVWLLVTLIGAIGLVAPGVRGAERVVNVAELEGIISPATADYIIQSISRSARDKAEVLIIKLDTPGGLDLSMRSIIKEVLGSSVPVVVYVHPSGARAASAGALITLAAHVAAMTPGTNIGAAHPVAMGGQISKTMEEKVVNDAAAYAESIATKRGRNVKWAVDAVRKSVSITESQALKLKVIEIVAPDLDSLLSQLDGRKVDVDGKVVTLTTKGATLKRLDMGTRQKILAILSNPNIAYILMLLGLAGLYFELANPGAIFPGVIGGISLILAFFAFQTLPINYAGVLLMILALILFIAEVKVVSHGILTIGGVISLALGSVMLFEPAAPLFRPAWSLVAAAVASVGGFFAFAITMALKARLSRPRTGLESLVGEEGEAISALEPSGKVFVHGEYWNAYSREAIRAGERVKVIEVQKGMKVKVQKVKEVE